MRQMCAALGVADAYDAAVEEQRQRAEATGFVLTAAADQVDEAEGTPLEALLQQEMAKAAQESGGGEGVEGEGQVGKRAKVQAAEKDITIIDSARVWLPAIGTAHAQKNDERNGRN